MGMLSEIVKINRETVQQILYKLNMRKVYAKMLPKNLFQEQRDMHQQICSANFEKLNEEPNLLEKVIICNEMWIFQYSP